MKKKLFKYSFPLSFIILTLVSYSIQFLSNFLSPYLLFNFYQNRRKLKKKKQYHLSTAYNFQKNLSSNRPTCSTTFPSHSYFEIFYFYSHIPLPEPTAFPPLFSLSVPWKHEIRAHVEEREMSEGARGGGRGSVGTVLVARRAILIESGEGFGLAAKARNDEQPCNPVEHDRRYFTPTTFKRRCTHATPHEGTGSPRIIIPFQVNRLYLAM